MTGERARLQLQKAAALPSLPGVLALSASSFAFEGFS